MELIVSGLQGAPVQFKHLFGRYVVGFRPWKHCIQCFESKIANGINPSMRDETIPLDDSFDLFYLCGVGQPDRVHAEPHQQRKATNIHLAVRPLKGSVAAVGSVYGATFRITHAQAIPIRSLPDDFEGLPLQHARCKNFQFGYQMFAASAVGESAPHEIIRERRPAV